MDAGQSNLHQSFDFHMMACFLRMYIYIYTLMWTRYSVYTYLYTLYIYAVTYRYLRVCVLHLVW